MVTVGDYPVLQPGTTGCLHNRGEIIVAAVFSGQIEHMFHRVWRQPAGTLLQFPGECRPLFPRRNICCKPAGQAFLGGQHFGIDQQVARCVLPDQSPQASSAERELEIPARHPEPGIGCGDTTPARGKKIGAGADQLPVTEYNHRKRCVMHRLQQRLDP